MNPFCESYVPLPLTGAPPTIVPPVVHVVGADDCGPNTVIVISPPAPLTAPDSVALISFAGIAVAVGQAAGADTVVVVADDVGRE